MFGESMTNHKSLFIVFMQALSLTLYCALVMQLVGSVHAIIIIIQEQGTKFPLEVQTLVESPGRAPASSSVMNHWLFSPTHNLGHRNMQNAWCSDGIQPVIGHACVAGQHSVTHTTHYDCMTLHQSPADQYIMKIILVPKS